MNIYIYIYVYVYVYIYAYIYTGGAMGVWVLSTSRRTETKL